MKVVYKGEDIVFDEGSSTWDLINKESNHLITSDIDIRKVKAYIDKKNKSKFKRIPIWVDRATEICEGEITSIVGNDCWISWRHNDGSTDRGKLWHHDRVFAKNLKNDKMVAEIRKLNTELTELSKTIYEMKNKLETVIIPKETGGTDD